MLEKNRIRLSGIEYDIMRLTSQMDNLLSNEKLMQEKVGNMWKVVKDMAEITGCQIEWTLSQPERYVVTKKGGDESA